MRGLWKSGFSAFSQSSLLCNPASSYVVISYRIYYRKGELMAKKNVISARTWFSLAGMTVSAFVFNTSEFMPIGLLTDIGAEFQLTEAETGFMITAYAWVVALCSLPLMLICSRIPYRRLLLGVIGVFFGGQLLSCLAVNYAMLVAARLVVAASHCIFWSIASPAAVMLVDREHRSLALSMIASGTSLAVVFGLPLGRLIGVYAGWRMTFGCVGVIAVLLFIYLFWLFPVLQSENTFSFRSLPELFHNKVLLGIYALTMLYATAYYMGYSYIEPFLLQVAALSDAGVTAVLTVFGAAGLLGSFLCSRLYLPFRFVFIRVIMLGITLALLLLYPASGSLYTLLPLFLCWGAVVMAYNIVFQAEIIQAAGIRASAVAMSMYSGIFNLGIGMGTGLGGMVVMYASVSFIGYAGGVVAAAAFAFTVGCLLRWLRKREKT